MGRRMVRDVIRAQRDRGATVFLNSHLLSEIEVTCDRVAFIKDGEIVASQDLRTATSRDGAAVARARARRGRRARSSRSRMRWSASTAMARTTYCVRRRVGGRDSRDRPQAGRGGRRRLRGGARSRRRWRTCSCDWSARIADYESALATDVDHGRRHAARGGATARSSGPRSVAAVLLLADLRRRAAFAGRSSSRGGRCRRSCATRSRAGC